MSSLFNIVFAFCVIGSCLSQLPPDIEKCKAGDVQCISRVASNLIAQNPNGRPDIGIPSFEPFRLDSILIDPSRSSEVTLRLELKDLAIYGLSKAKIERMVGFEKNPSTSKFELYARVPKIRFEAEYKSDGRVLVIPVHGHGLLNLNMTDVKISAKFKPKVYQKNDGKTYIDVDKIKVLIEPGPSKIHFKSFVDDGSALGESFNAFVNENWNELWREIYPAFNEALLKIIKQLLHDILTKISYDDLYSD